MKNVTDSFVSLGHWPSAGSFGFNTDILATNPINLSVVLGVLIFFGKGVCAENYKNKTIQFEQQKAINQVRQRVFHQSLQGALGTLNSCLNNELHLRTINANIGMFGAMKEITD
ncbi:hypothetical protein MKW92_042594 [Papaver armeniacum]|nr:hypothetical protein MKW92_042594 [Papaver armeniacum]